MGANNQSGLNYSQFKKKINVMCMRKKFNLLIDLVYLRLEDFDNLLLIATDDSLIR